MADLVLLFSAAYRDRHVVIVEELLNWYWM